MSATNTDAIEVLDALLHKAINDDDYELLDAIIYTTACHFNHDDGIQLTDQLCSELLAPNRVDDFYEFESLCDVLRPDE